ncbi:MAG: carbohydrate-binding domain-containing protein [Bacteroidaceae bacterium]|nr:carbohydrate-binding domain-containing protein [Bacteroidaceae bacterium]
MRKGLYALGFILILSLGCSPDSLSTVIEFPSNTGSVTDTTTVAPQYNLARFADDSISQTVFDRTIQIVFADDRVQITGDDNNTISATGCHVTVNNTTDEKVMYELKGTAEDGSIKLYSSRKQALVLDGLDLTSTKGAAINNQSKKKCFVVVKGSNSLKDATTYSSTPADEDEKAVLFSEGQLVFSGDGTLTVTAQGKAGITSDNYVHFMESPVINVTSSTGHGIRGKEAVIISNGTVSVSVSADMKKGITSDSVVCINGGETMINISGSAAYDDEDAEYKGTAGIKADYLFLMNAGTLSVINSGKGGKGISGDMTGCFNGGTVRVATTGTNYGNSSGGNRWGQSSSGNSVSAKGIKFDGNLFFNGGTVTVNCTAHEGIESKGNIIVTDGVVYSYSAADDAINSSGTFTVEGGYLCGHAVRNDGLDANGNFYIKGGMVYAIGTSAPEVGIDANTEGGCKLYVTGGTIIAIGGLESGSSLTQSCYQASWSKSTWYSMAVGNDEFAFKTPASGGTTLVVSGSSQPVLKSGVTVQDGTEMFEGLLNTGGSISGGTDVTLSSYSGGDGFGPGPGGGGFRPGPGGGFSGRPGGW